MATALPISGVVLLALSGLVASNFLYDRGSADSMGRRAAHMVGGVAFLAAVLWLEVWTAVALSGVMLLSVLALRLGYRRGLRGVSRSDANQDWAELAYPLAGIASLTIGWGLLGDRWLGFMPIAFMAWGDSAAGLVRAGIRTGHMARVVKVSVGTVRITEVLPSVAMLGVCLGAALLFEPYWIGALGAIFATVSERFRLIAHRLWDENWLPDDPAIVASSLVAMGALARVPGV